ncbi:hypothetical protein ACR6C2_26905 [Streptomyces sp. INA 01156]
MQFSRAARRLATQADDPRLASVVVSSRQFDRWMSGELKQLPRPDTCRILEELLGRAARELFARLRRIRRLPQHRYLRTCRLFPGSPDSLGPPGPPDHRRRESGRDRRPGSPAGLRQC